jgi:hypothetical protein
MDTPPGGMGLPPGCLPGLMAILLVIGIILVALL